MKRPISLTIAAVIVFLAGLSGLVADCWRVHGFEIAPSWNLFTMIAGLGLLKFSRMARWYVLFVFGPFFLMMLPFTVWTIFNPAQIDLHFPSVLIDDRPHAISPWFEIISIMVSYLAISGYVLYVLLRHSIYELFHGKRRNSPAMISV